MEKSIFLLTVGVENAHANYSGPKWTGGAETQSNYVK